MGRISLTVGSGSLVGITIIIIDKCLSVCVEGVHFIVNFIICFSLEILSINERRKFIKGKKDYRRHSLICTAISIFIFTPLSPYLWEKFQFDWTSIAHMEYGFLYMCVTIWRASKIQRHLFNSVNGFFRSFSLLMTNLYHF